MTRTKTIATRNNVSLQTGILYSILRLQIELNSWMLKI